METGDESATPCFIVCSLFVKNAASCEALRLKRSSHLQRWRSFSERFGPRMLMPDNLQNEQSSCSFSRDNKQAITSSYYKNTDYWLENQTLMLKSVPQMLKKWRIVVHKISKVRQTTCNRIKKILDEATRIVNVFLISWFFYLFLLCSISFLVNYAFILRYEAWVNLWERLVSLKTFLKSAQKQSLSSEICSGSSQSFFSETGLENSLEIPAKSAVFPVNLPLKIPRNLTFFSATYQKPWK